jgi:hypothetical protein
MKKGLSKVEFYCVSHIDVNFIQINNVVVELYRIIQTEPLIFRIVEILLF